MNRVVVIGLALGFLVGLALFLVEPEVPERAEDPSGPEPAVLSQIEIKDYDQSRLKLRVYAARAEVFEETEVTRLTQVHGILLPEKLGGESTRFKAAFGKLEGKTKRVTLTGDIRIELPRGRVILTQILYFDQEKELLWGDQPLRMLGPGDQVDAAGLTYQLKDAFLTLDQPAVEVEL
ncbi:MAG: LPS export ABC transporter periplasmic protein LptC [bacterium]|nr:LPS export ABC transporter periplasmic protein LptC [bacterium]